MPTDIELSGTITASGGLLGALSIPNAGPSLLGSIYGTSALAGDLSLSGPAELSGTIAGFSGLSGMLTIPGDVLMAGTISGMSSLTGTIQNTVPLSGSIVGESSLAGVLYVPPLLKPVPWRRFVSPVPTPLFSGSVQHYRHRPPRHFFADSLRYYLTGADADGSNQADAAESIGGFRSAVEAKRTSTFVSLAMAGLQIDIASRINGTDGAVGHIVSLGGSYLRYTAPGSGSMGPAVRVPPGKTESLQDGDDPSRFVRVTRTTTGLLIGNANIEFADILNNVIGMANVADAESTAGSDRYRAVMIRNLSDLPAQSVKAWVDLLATSATTSTAQLGASGAGQIGGAPEAFIDWPVRGWARVEQSGGTLREIVYYSSRSDSSLTVPSLGRGRLGTSAAAGSASDVAKAVPGVRIGWEAASPLIHGSVQTIADDTTEPTGISWSTAVSSASGVAIGAIGGGQQGALWIHREIPEAASAIAKATTRIRVQFTIAGETYSELLAGMFRIAVNAIEGYELHIGQDGPPDLSAEPDETFSSLPYETETEFEAGHSYHLVTNFRNRYGLVSQSSMATVIAVDDEGEGGSNPPSGPQDVAISAAAGGAFLVSAIYPYDADGDDQADEWLIFLRTDGIDPDPDSDTPVTISMSKSDGFSRLAYLTTTYPSSTTAKAIVRTARALDGATSTNANIVSIENDTDGPQSPRGIIVFRRVAEQEQ